MQLHALSLEIRLADKKALEPIKEYFSSGTDDKKRCLRSIKNFFEVLQNDKNISASCKFSQQEASHLIGFFLQEKIEDRDRKRLKYLQEKELEIVPLTDGNCRYDYLSFGRCTWIPTIKNDPEKSTFESDILAQTNWLGEGFSQFDPTEKLSYPVIMADREFFTKNGKLFLEVYHAAKFGTEEQRQEILYRLTCWKSQRNLSSSMLDSLWLIISFPNKFPNLVDKNASALDRYHFLKDVEKAHEGCDRFTSSKQGKVDPAPHQPILLPTSFS